MVGTSAAARVIYDAAAVTPRSGLFLYRLDRNRVCEGGALSDGGNLHAWLLATLRDADTAAIAERPAAAHGLVFLPFLGGERSLGWDASRRGLVSGLSFATTPLDVAQAALEGVCYRLAAVLDAIDGVESVVVTGGALLANPAWVQVLADVLGTAARSLGGRRGVRARRRAGRARAARGAGAACADRPRRRAAGRPARDPSGSRRQNNG